MSKVLHKVQLLLDRWSQDAKAAFLRLQFSSLGISDKATLSLVHHEYGDLHLSVFRDGASDMDNLLKPITTTKKVQNNIEKFESLSLGGEKLRLRQQNTVSAKPTRPIIELHSDSQEDIVRSSTTLKNSTDRETKEVNVPQLRQTQQRDSTAFLQQSYLTQSVSSSLSEDAAEILKSQPDHDDLKAVIEYLQYGIDCRHDFNVKVTSPSSAMVINALVNTTLPDIWANLQHKRLSPDESQIKASILVCLRSGMGLGALLTRIKRLSTGSTHADGQVPLLATISVLADTLKGPKTILALLDDSQGLYKQEMQQKLYWHEIVASLAGGRILSTLAQAMTAVEELDQISKDVSWLASGAEYSRWLAQGIVYAAVNCRPGATASWKMLCQLFGRALSLGHRDVLVSELYTSLLLGEKALWTQMHQLLQGSTPYEQKVVFDAVLQDLARRHLNEISIVGFQENETTSRTIAGAAALVAGLIKNNEVLEEHLVEWLVVANAGYAAIGLAVRRALIATLARSEDKLEDILDRSLSAFGDKLQIQHGSSLHQEAYAQTILLAIGYLKRLDLQRLRSPSISSLQMHAVSNRLAASIPRSRFLGMIVGVAMSRAVDAADKVLDFDIEEMKSSEAEQFLRLPDLKDTVGDVINLRDPRVSVAETRQSTKLASAKSKRVNEQVRAHTSKIISIEELVDDSSEEDDGLIPYAKPDSDPEDSDEDATLIDRNKPSAPVYIKDLIKQLQADDKPDTIHLALKTAPALIKRKTGFGTELLDNVHTLVTVLLNVQAGISDEDSGQYRLESLVACFVAKPDTIGPSMASIYFEGDFSISQRVTILTAIGLGSRDLAGFKHELSVEKQEDDFPSKRLPHHLQPAAPKQLQAQWQNPITALTITAAQSTLRPMALAAADKMTGPDVLKTRTFSSRMDVQKRHDEKSQARKKMIPKNLHNLLTKSIYLPLCCRMSLVLSAGMTNSLAGTILSPSLMRLFLQTLTLVLHTLGPSASLHLPTLTHETLLLLTSLYIMPRLATDPLVLPALLHLLLALIDTTIEAGVTAQERLITEHGNQVAALVNWARSLENNISIPDVEDVENSMPWNLLAAGIQVKWVEMGQRFQGRMLGLTSNDLDAF